MKRAFSMSATMVAAISFVMQGIAWAAGSGTPPELVLVSATTVSRQALVSWKNEGFRGVVVVLDEETPPPVVEAAADRVSAAALALYFWIEVGRNPKLAEAHPRWMASLGMHDDWQKRFPGSRRPNADEVAKAWPWVPIGYRDAFEAHLNRIERLLAQAPRNYRGLLINDLQGGPASCGCGNLQCRWAIDYHVAATGDRIKGDAVAAQFVSAVRKLVSDPDKAFIPVWTTECEEADLPADRPQGKPSTGLCGSVGCSTGLCPKEFSKQWSALVRGTDSPIALLGLHRELDRSGPFYGPDPVWVTNAVHYSDSIPAAHGGERVPRDRLWVVVQGRDAIEESAARQLARQLGVSAVIVARTRIDQSYEPRLIRSVEK